jgi:hypothetical protein
LGYGNDSRQNGPFGEWSASHTKCIFTPRVVSITYDFCVLGKVFLVPDRSRERILIQNQAIAEIWPIFSRVIAISPIGSGGESYTRDYWQAIAFFDIGADSLAVSLLNSIKWPQLMDLNHGVLRMLYQRNLLAATMTTEFQTVLTHELLFPLYPFDLTLNKKLRSAPQPGWPPRRPP